MKGVIISVFVVLAIVLMVEQGQAAINCGQVDACLTPCVPYLTQGGSPSAPCCSGVQGIKGMTTTLEDKRAACKCVKTAANRYPSLKDDAAQALPDKCGVKLDIPISRNTNCDGASSLVKDWTNGAVAFVFAPMADATTFSISDFLTQEGSPSPPCCSGGQGIKGMTTTPEDKRTACKCVKTAADRYPSLKDDAAQALPEKPHLD